MLEFDIDYRLEAKEPAFLRRLRSEQGAGDSGRHERPLARPRKPGGDLDDDGPTYVDEQSQDVVTNEEYEALISNTEPPASITNNPLVPQSVEQPEQKVPVDESVTEIPAAKENVATVGRSTKRKLAKVVGEKEEIKDGAKSPKNEVKSAKQEKKSKKVKLSFDDA